MVLAGRRLCILERSGQNDLPHIRRIRAISYARALVVLRSPNRCVFFVATVHLACRSERLCSAMRSSSCVRRVQGCAQTWVHRSGPHKHGNIRLRLPPCVGRLPRKGGNLTAGRAAVTLHRASALTSSPARSPLSRCTALAAQRRRRVGVHTCSPPLPGEAQPGGTRWPRAPRHDATGRAHANAIPAPRTPSRCARACPWSS